MTGLPARIAKTYWPVGAAVLIATVIFLVFPPFYGLMDDSNYIVQAPKFLEGPFLPQYAQWLSSDMMASGRFRPFLPFLMIFFYGPTQDSPLALHVFHAICALTLLALLSLAFGRLWARVYPERPVVAQPVVFVPVFFSLLLLYPWTHIGIALPAMQEKMVLLAGAIALWGFTSSRISLWPLWARFGFLCFLLLVGSFTREQFVLFFPLLLAAVFVRERKWPWETLGYLTCMLALLVVIWLLGRHTGYKAKYGLATVRLTFAQSRSIWLFLGLSAASLVGVLADRSAALRAKVPRLCFGFSLLGFVLLMAPWGLGGYLNVVAAPFSAACVLTLFPRDLATGRRRRVLLLGGLPLLAVAAFGVEIGMDAVVKNDLGRILQSEEMKAAGRSGSLFAPCTEGMEVMNQYTVRFFGYQLNAQLPAEGQPPPAGKSYWVVARRLGCWPDTFGPDEALRSGKARALWGGRAGWSWKLLELSN